MHNKHQQDEEEPEETNSMGLSLVLLKTVGQWQLQNQRTVELMEHQLLCSQGFPNSKGKQSVTIPISTQHR